MFNVSHTYSQIEQLLGISPRNKETAVDLSEPASSRPSLPPGRPEIPFPARLGVPRGLRGLTALRIASRSSTPRWPRRNRMHMVCSAQPTEPLDLEGLAARILRPDRSALAAACAAAVGVDEPRDAWIALTREELVPAEWLDAETRQFVVTTRPGTSCSTSWSGTARIWFVCWSVRGVHARVEANVPVELRAFALEGGAAVSNYHRRRPLPAPYESAAPA